MIEKIRISKSSVTFWVVVLGFLLYCLHFLERDPSSSYERPIISDAKGYYAYLPAIFIYQDLEYEFIPEMDEKYYSVGKDKHIFIEVEGRKVNKTFPGVAVLYLPFFLVAHFLASIFGMAADGYSNVYQYFFDFGQFFYATLGFVVLAKVLLRLNYTKKVVLASVSILVLGSNLFYYVFYDQSVTHVYNFFLINSMVWLVLRFKDHERLKYWLLSILSFGLLLIIRPTGFLSVFILLFFIPDLKFWKNFFCFSIKPKQLLLALSCITLIASIPLLLWKVQSGNWIVYSYGEEGFDFSNPQIFSFIFSYAKGWFLYSPILLVTLVAGVIVMYRNDEQKNRLFFLSSFIMLSIYVFSSWWCWYYGFSFGQRPMVDFYALFGLLMAESVSLLKSRLTKAMAFVVVVLFVLLNLLQSYQHYNGFYIVATPTSEMYWDNFLSLKKKARVYPENTWKLLSTHKFDFESDSADVVSETFLYKDAYSGDFVIKSELNKEYSASVGIESSDFLKAKHIVVSFYVKAETELNEIELITQFDSLPGTYQSFGFNSYVINEEWVRVELYYSPIEVSENFVIYFWNKSTVQTAYYDDVTIRIYSE